MNCKKYQEWISAGIDDRLDERQARLLQEHLAACPVCRPAKADLERIIAQIRTLPKVEPPPDLLDSIHQRIATPPKTSRLIWRVLALPQTRVALAAALLMIVVFYGYQPMTSVTRDALPAKQDKAKLADGTNLKHGQVEQAKRAPTPVAIEPLAKELAQRAPASFKEKSGLAKDMAQADRMRAMDADRAPAVDAVTKVTLAKSAETRKAPMAAALQRKADVNAIADQDKKEGVVRLSSKTVAKKDDYALQDTGAKGGAAASMTQEVRLQDRTQIPEERQSAARGGALVYSAAVPAAPRASVMAPSVKPQRPLENEARFARKEQAEKSAGMSFGQGGASVPGGETSVKLLVVAANPAAVLRTLEPYRQEWQRDQAMDKSITAAKPAAMKVVPVQRESEKKAADIPAESQAKGQATITTITLLVPAGEYSELLKKIKALGEITDETKLTDKFQPVATDALSISNQSADLIYIHIRIQPR